MLDPSLCHQHRDQTSISVSLSDLNEINHSPVFFFSSLVQSQKGVLNQATYNKGQSILVHFFIHWSDIDNSWLAEVLDMLHDRWIDYMLAWGIRMLAHLLHDVYFLHSN